VTSLGPEVLAPGTAIRVHRHRKAQLILTLSGLLICEVDQGRWVVPPHCALWIPGGVPHGLTSTSGVAHICSLYVEPQAVPTLPQECCTLAVTPLTQALLLQAMELPELYELNGPDGRLAQVLLDRLATCALEKLHFPMPRHAKLRKIAEAMLAHPAERAPVAEWGRRVGAAERTLSRLLQAEVGMSFGRWRRQLHVLIALQRLTQDVSVQTVALDLGYESASAFITMFRKTLGKPPTRYLAEHHIGPETAPRP